MRLVGLISLLAFMASPLAASIEACDRLTHVSHGGVSDHVDLGRGHVMWTEWWSQEGTYKDVWLADCRSGMALEVRAQEDRITDRYFADRSEDIRALISERARKAPTFFTLMRVADDIARIRSDLTVKAYDTQFCACAAAYPEGVK